MGEAALDVPVWPEERELTLELSHNKSLPWGEPANPSLLFVAQRGLTEWKIGLERTTLEPPLE